MKLRSVALCALILGTILLTASQPLDAWYRASHEALLRKWAWEDNAAANAAYTWSLAQSTEYQLGLPPGLTLDQATGLISGTPTAAGVYVFVVKVRDAAGSTFLKPLLITIDPKGLTITTSTVVGGTVGLPYTCALAVKPDP